MLRHVRLLPVLALLAACGEGPTSPGATPPRELTLDERSVLADANAFAFELLREVRAREDAPNVFVSPLSASMALAMTMNGAAGDTWTQMRDALGHDGLEEPAINGAYRGLLDVLPGLDPTVEMGIANSVWTRQGFPVLPSFYDAARRHFDAEVAELDFGDPATLDVINGWVEEATRGRIPTILDRINPQDVMFLINAVYFKGTWTTRFDPARTVDAYFRRADGSTVTAKMMRLEQVELPFAAGAGWEAVELTYGDGLYSMVVVVPQEADGLEALVGSLDEEGWADLLSRLSPQAGSVTLPRLKLEYDVILNEPLQALGMVDAFGAADFSRLTPERVCVSFVRQKTFLEVDERGTEAAAVTVVGIGRTSYGPTGVHATHPFLFAIRERTTGAILFIGTVGDPTVEVVEAGEVPAGC